MSRNDLRRSDLDAMNTTAGPSTPLATVDRPVYTRITGNCGTPVAGLNSSFFAPGVSGTHSNHIFQMDDNRTSTPNGRETPQLYHGVYTALSVQEAPNFMVDHAPERLVPSSKAARDHSLLVRQCTYLTDEYHKPRPDLASAGAVDRRKKREIEVGMGVFRAEISLLLTSNQDLGAARDGLMLLDDAVAGSLISDCEDLLNNHTPAAGGSLSTPDGYKLSMMRVSP